MWTFYLTIWTSILGIASLHLAIQTLSELWDKFTIARNKSQNCEMKKVTITLYPLYSMAEISFHRFHMCKREKQTNIKMHSPAHILTLYLTSSSPFFWSNNWSSSQLFISLSQALLFSLSLILCVVLHPQNQFKEIFFYSMLM